MLQRQALVICASMTASVGIGRARSSAPGYTTAYRDWLGHIDRIIAPHQITHGGSVILYNVENEYAANTDPAYMADIEAKARAWIHVPPPRAGRGNARHHRMQPAGQS